MSQAKLRRDVCQAMAAVFFVVLCSNAAAVDIATKPAPGAVVVATNNWGSQVVGAHVIKALLEVTGHVVQLKPTAIDLQMAALGEGELHIQGEIRESVMSEALDRAVGAGRVVRAGRHDAVSREGWWYPEYVQGLCPGLPDWQALRRCASVFAPKASGPRGRFIAGPKVWRHKDRERIEALDLPFQVQHAESAQALLEALREAALARRPILLFRWSPHWTDRAYAGRYIEFPPYDENCITNPEWGPNPKAIYDCELYRPSPISKAVWADLGRRAPCAFQVVKNIAFTNEDFAAMEEMVAVLSLSPETAAQRWLDDNAPRWRKWIPKCRATS